MMQHLSTLNLPLPVMMDALRQLNDLAERGYDLNTLSLTAYANTNPGFWILYFGGISLYVTLDS